MHTLNDYRALALSLIKDESAFLRIDRSDALFVTDAPRRNPSRFQSVLPLLEEHFIVSTENGLSRLTPKFSSAPAALRDACLIILKGDPDTKKREIRTRLAIAMRQRNQEEIDFLNCIERSMLP
ncbi:MAG: hypothetical protein IJC48_10215 [Clostridia bacterium]|nr:hypothetical protein [Clostridia bacterium]MBQ4158273.1 hypothetical protein [Clostridia bacterium]